MTMTAGPPNSTSFGRYQKEAVLFNSVMPCKHFCAIFGWLRAATQYHLAPMCTTLPTSGWLTCPIPWQQQHQQGSPFRWFAQCCSTCWQLAVDLASRPQAASATFYGCPPLFNSMGGGTETILWAAHYCTKACHLWDIMVVQSLRLPQFFRGCKEQPHSGKFSLTLIRSF